MASLAELKQTLVDVMLGSKAFTTAAQLGDALKAYDPGLKIMERTATQQLVDALTARRSALAAKLSDLNETIKLADDHEALEAVGDVVEELKARKASQMPPDFVPRLTAARKADVSRLEKERIAPAIEAYLKAHQEKYDFVGGALQPKGKVAKPAEPPVDPQELARARKESDELTDLIATRDKLFGAKSPLNQDDLRTLTRDKLTFLPNFARGGDTKKLLAEEKLAIEAAKEFETVHAKGRAALDGAYETFQHNGKAYRDGGVPLMVWKNRAEFVRYFETLKSRLQNFRDHLNLWMEQRTTARLDLKSKKVIACGNLARQADVLLEAYGKLL